jgi:hypothetical protein
MNVLRALARKPLTGLKQVAVLNKVNIPNFSVNWGQNGHRCHGTVSNPTDVDKLTFDFQI